MQTRLNKIAVIFGLSMTLCWASPALAATPEITQPATTVVSSTTSTPATTPSQQLIVGQNVSQFSELAAKTMKGLLYCIGVLFLGAGIYRRFGPQSQSQLNNAIEILSQRNIAPRMNLLLVRVEGQKILIATTPTDVRLLLGTEREQEMPALEQICVHG